MGESNGGVVALPGVPALGAGAGKEVGGEEARAVHALKPGASEWKPIGTLHSALGNLGLCMLRCDANLNHAESFGEQAWLPNGTKLATADGRPLGLRAPPYAFTE